MPINKNRTDRQHKTVKYDNVYIQFEDLFVTDFTFTISVQYFYRGKKHIQIYSEKATS